MIFIKSPLSTIISEFIFQTCLEEIYKQNKQRNFHLGAHAKFQNHRRTPSGRKVTQAERKRERRRRQKTLSIVATTFCLQCPRAAHAVRMDHAERNKHKNLQKVGKVLVSVNHTQDVPDWLRIFICMQYIHKEMDPAVFIEVHIP